MVFTAMIAADSIKSSNIMESIGITFDVSDITAQDIIKTYCVDAVILLFTPLIIQNGRFYRKLEKNSREEYDAFVNSNLGLHSYYYTLISITVIISTFGSLLIPSVL